MPFFRSLNILFIHIPKTGGSSIEQYLCIKSNTKLMNLELFMSTSKLWDHSSQHATYQELYDKKDILNIDFNSIQIITAVRNPYERALSDLFFFKLININMNKDEIYNSLDNYIQSVHSYDNHKLPQSNFIIDSNGVIPSNIVILKTETLNDDMFRIGYTDFNLNSNTTYRKSLDYYTLMNNSFIKRINEYYDMDFKLLGYFKISI